MASGKPLCMTLFLPCLDALHAGHKGPPVRLGERALQARGLERVCGADEAGRGPLCGPVVASAVILPAEGIEGLDDSKKLSARQRETLFDVILSTAHVGVAISSPATIDRMNILQASLDAMARAIAALPVRADCAMIDGNKLPRLAVPAVTLIKGDGREMAIAAASIVAKVVRDRMMAVLDAAHPGYGLGQHMGYPTAQHREALSRMGPTPHHRTSFKGVRS